MTLTLAVTCLVLAYAGACWALPFTNCRICRGDGYRKTFVMHKMRPCPVCKGHGQRLRLGRRAFNYLRKIHRDGTRKKATT